MPASKIAIRVQHTASRDDDPVFRRLEASLAPYPYRVVTDRKQGPGNRTWHTYRRCLHSVPRSATHLLVLQDDVSLCRNFVKAAHRVADARPGRLVSFFLGNKPSSSVITLFRSCENGDRYCELDNRTWQPAQALCWPVALIGPMLSFAEVAYREGRPDDELVGQFLNQTHLSALQTIPTLVQHEGAFGVDSSLGASGGHYRRAVCHIGGHDPLQIDWT